MKVIEIETVTTKKIQIHERGELILVKGTPYVIKDVIFNGEYRNQKKENLTDVVQYVVEEYSDDFIEKNNKTIIISQNNSTGFPIYVPPPKFTIELKEYSEKPITVIEKKAIITIQNKDFDYFVVRYILETIINDDDFDYDYIAYTKEYKFLKANNVLRESYEIKKGEGFDTFKAAFDKIILPINE